MFELKDHVKAGIGESLPGFQEWLKTDEARTFLEERDVKIKELRSLLDRDKIEGLTEPDYRRIIALLWAYTGWTNKDYVAERTLKGMRFDDLKSELKELLYGGEPLSKRYDRFFEKVKGLGPAGVTEILAFMNSECGIWNDKSRSGLEILGLGEELPTKKYRISGSEYERVNEALKSIFKEVYPREAKIDLLEVDLFLFYLATRRQAPQPTVEEDYDFDHDEIVDELVEIGNGLGFEAEKEWKVAKGARVDVVWRAKIANLGIVSYVFEVQKGGSIDALILNLQRAKNDPTVQKLVIVANTLNLRRIREEVESLSEDFRRSLAYLEAKDVERASDLLSELNSIIDRLQLIKR
jgi:hypothetical protein